MGKLKNILKNISDHFILPNSLLHYEKITRVSKDEDNTKVSEKEYYPSNKMLGN